VTEQLELTRRTGAPAERVFEFWTVPDQLEKWWWPPRFKTIVKIDLRPQGSFEIRSTGLPNNLGISGRYLEVQPPRRLRYTWQWDGEDRATDVTVHFTSQSGTAIRIVHSGFSSAEERDKHIQGWNDCIDRLMAALSQD
jgi:uncharacterized protein YndB with AHSA1/START domain